MMASAAAAVGTLSWFASSADISNTDNPINGSANSAYFAYGNGSPTTPEDPDSRVYGITVPRHLYNLAWLQYLGFFNLEEENGKQYYFELGDNIDMTGWVLPPIGTEDNPFIGNFNGNGYVVSGLTVSNNFSDFNRHPGVVTAGNFEQPHILGFFGAIGDYNGDFEGTDYSSTANEFLNTGLTGLTIKTYLPDSLMGIAAGYVDGTMKNIAVDASTITMDSSIEQTTTSYGGHTTNISDFSLVGFTTNMQQVKKVDETIYDIEISAGNEFNAAEQGESNGWGGSINMRTIYQRLYALKVYPSIKNETLNHRTNRTYYDDVEDTSARVTRSNSRMYYYHGYDNAHSYLGNYSFLNRGTDYDSFMYLSGGHYESQTYYTNTVHSGYKITDGTNYLTYNGSTLGNTTTSGNGTPWTFTQYSGDVYYIQYKYQSDSYNRYLYNNGGTLTIGTGTPNANNARWTVTKDGNNLSIVSVSDSTKKIYYYGGAWSLITSSGTESYYVIQSGTNYISASSASGSTVTNTTSEAEAAHFQVDSSDNNRVYFQKTGSTTKYYLTAYRNGNTTGLRTNTNATANRYYVFTYTNSTLSARYNNNTNYYVRYNNGWAVATSNYSITLTQKSINYSSMYLSNTLDSPESSTTGPDYYQSANDIQKGNSNTKMYFDYSDTTYFPINVKTDGGSFGNATAVNTAINNGNFDPVATNTGYITAGSDYSSVNANVTSSTNADTYRDNISKVRVSEYAISNIDNSFSTSYTKYTQFVDSAIYTINSNGTKRTMAQEYTEDNYPRYLEAKKSFYSNALTTDYNSETDTYKVADNVYGLHFLNTSISKETVVNARNVSILGNNADRYELPVNAVDFNLKQKGNVNFFAGTYFTGNNSFFSLHEIFRNDDASPKADEGEYNSFNTISDIKEIEEIYTTDVGTTTTKYANIYKYKGKTGNEMYSVPYRFDVEQNKFEMSSTSTTESTTQYVYATMGQTEFDDYVSTYGYQLRFKTSQIGVNSGSISKDNSIFYYEFPMNQGEYCLGSVDGGTGAYLLYLDIAANASKVQRTIISEHFLYEELVQAFPYGVALYTLPNPETFEDETPVIDITTEIDYTDSACVEIQAGYTESFSIDRDDGDVTLTRSNPSTAPPVYASEDIELIHDSGSSTPIDVEVISNDVIEVKRLTYLDVNVNMVTLTKTVITDTIVNEGTPTRTIVQENYNSTDPTEDPTSTYVYNSETDQRDDIVVYNTSNGVRYANDDLVDQDVLPISVSSDAVLIVRIVQKGGQGYEEDIAIVISIDEDDLTGTYYLFDNYVITITPDGEDVVIYVKTYTGDQVIYYGEVEVTGEDQVITIEV